MHQDSIVMYICLDMSGVDVDQTGLQLIEDSRLLVFVRGDDQLVAAGEHVLEGE